MNVYGSLRELEELVVHAEDVRHVHSHPQFSGGQHDTKSRYVYFMSRDG